VAVVAEDDPFEGAAMPVASLAERRLLGLRSCRHARGLEAELEAAGADVAAMMRSDDNGTLQAMAAEGLGTAVMPRLAVAGDDPRVRVLALPELPKRTIGLAWHRDRTLARPAEDLIARLRDGAHGAARSLLHAA
jgi:DNA-binding transcriptional LysR family regulator